MCHIKPEKKLLIKPEPTSLLICQQTKGTNILRNSPVHSREHHGHITVLFKLLSGVHYENAFNTCQTYSMTLYSVVKIQQKSL